MNPDTQRGGTAQIDMDAANQNRAGLTREEEARAKAWKQTNLPRDASPNRVISPDAVTLNRSEIVHGPQTGEVDRKPEISGETVAGYEQFLEDYVRDLGKMAETPSGRNAGETMLDVIMKKPANSTDPDPYKYDRMIIELYGVRKRSADGKTYTIYPDMQAIREGLRGRN